MADSINTINVGGIDKEVEDTVARSSGSSANDRCTTLESNVSNLAARVEEIIAPTGEAPSPAEVVDARIGFDDAIYNSLGAAIRTQVSMINNSIDLEKIDIINQAWEQGGINADGSENSDAARIRTPYLHVYPKTKAISITVNNGYEYAAKIYNSSKSIIDSFDYMSLSTDYDLPSNAAYVRFIARNKTAPNNAILPSEGTNVSCLMYSDSSEETRYLLGISKKHKASLEKDQINLLDGVLWFQGSILNSGEQETREATRIRSEYFPLDSDYSKLTCVFPSSYSIILRYYDANKQRISVDGWSTTSPWISTIPNGAKYLAIVFRHSDNSTIVTGEAENLVINCFMPIIKTITDLSGIGECNYYGKRVNLSPLSNQCSCDIEKWIDVTPVNYPDMGNYLFYRNQSIAIYDDSLFVFFNGGDGVVFDYDTKEIIGTITPGETIEYNHQNSAQFLPYFYDENDDYPLIAISKYGNVGSRKDDDYCLIFRITKSGNTYTMSLINKIRYEGDTIGNSWGVDVHTNSIIMVAYIDHDYTVSTDNPLYFKSWELPSKSEVISGIEIVLRQSNCIHQFETNYGILQAIYGMYGKVYMAIYIDGYHGILVVNLNTGEKDSIIPVDDLTEAEGIAIYKNKIYISNREGSDISYTNPMTIYEIDCH